MATVTLTTSNFQIQYESTEFSGPGESALIQQRAQALHDGCEGDYATLCQWFGVAVGAGFGPSNRVIITLSKSLGGGVNYGYSTSNPRMTLGASLGSSNGRLLSLFVAEMIEVLMGYRGPWVSNISGGEGLSRVAAQLLHPEFGSGFVNAWLASDPTKDSTAAVADDGYRKDWVSQNFTGGQLKAGGYVAGDDDSYSIGCAMLFIYYLKSQLGFTMAQIVQKAGATLATTYQNLTEQTDGFWKFRTLLAEHFPPGTKSAKDDPFPLSVVSVSTGVAPALGASGNATIEVATRIDQRIYYTWWNLGQGGKGFGELDGDGRSDAAPAAALVGPQHDYLFVAIKGLDGSLYLNQGGLGKGLVGWQRMAFQTNVAAALASSGNTSALVAVDANGRIFYDYWQLGQGGRGFTELSGAGRTDASPAAALVGPQHNYLFVAVKGLDGTLYLNQGELGKGFVGWRPVAFKTAFAPALASSGNTTAIVAVDQSGRIFYDYWELGQGGRGFTELAGDGRTDAPPAAALVGDQHDYLFVAVKGLDTKIYLNQGRLGHGFVGWQ